MHLRYPDAATVELSARTGMTSKDWTLEPWINNLSHVEELLHQGTLEAEVNKQVTILNHLNTSTFGYVDGEFVEWCKIACRYILEDAKCTGLTKEEKIMTKLMLNMRWNQ